jgi:hypothetical protein
MLAVTIVALPESRSADNARDAATFADLGCRTCATSPSLVALQDGSGADARETPGRCRNAGVRSSGMSYGRTPGRMRKIVPV